MVIYRDAEEKFIKRVEFYASEEEVEDGPAYLYHDPECTSKVTKEECLGAMGMIMIYVNIEGATAYTPPLLVHVFGDYVRCMAGDVHFYTAEYVPEPDDSEDP